jgi:iron transport multicopper oxidase
MFGILVFLSVALCFALQTHAETVSYDWNLDWVSVNPDGELSRPAIGINGKWPNQAIEASVGDRIIITLHNQLGNETASLHFHGIYQQDSNGMDGPPEVSQCEIPPGASFTYDFLVSYLAFSGFLIILTFCQVNQPGSYWYHSHSSGQISDGLRGPLIVKDPDSPYAGKYSDELVVTVSDWYHDQAPFLIPYFLSPSQNPSSAEPIPYSSLINEAQDVKLAVKPATTYLVRIISMAAFSQIYVGFDQHDLTIIAIDGIYVEPRKVSTIYLAVAQRYDVLLTTKGSKDKNYAFFSNLDQDKFVTIPGYLHPNATGYLVYDDNQSLSPEAPMVDRYDIIDDFTLVPQDGQPLLSGRPAASIVLNLDFFQRDGQNRCALVPPSVLHASRPAD